MSQFDRNTYVHTGHSYMLLYSADLLEHHDMRNRSNQEGDRVTKAGQTSDAWLEI